MNPIPEIDNLEWSEPRTVKGVYVLKSAPPTPEFWDLYRAHKREMENAGIKANCFNKVWSVNWWQRNGKFEYPILSQIAIATHRELDIEPLVNETGLIPYQIPLVQHMVAVMKNEKASINGSGTGIGKTFITLAVSRERQKKLVVICPKSITVDWQRAAAAMDAHLIGAYGWEWIKTGKTPFGYWQMEPFTASGKKRAKASKGKFIWTLPADTELVFDEAHRASGRGTQNAHIVEEAKDSGYVIHTLSATLANDPTKMNALGYVLGLHDGSKEGFENFMRTYGCQLVKIPIPKKKNQKSRYRDDDEEEGRGFTPKIKIWKFKGSSKHLQALHSHIFPSKGVRIKPEDLGDAFPETQIMAKAYEIEEARQITAAYNEMLRRIAEIEFDENMEGRQKQANILAEMTKARMEVEFLKINLVVSLTRDAIEEGMSNFIAVNFRQTLFGRLSPIGVKQPGLLELLKIKSYIVGGQDGNQRRDMIDAFQADKHWIIAGISKACREGLNLHDLHGNRPRASWIMPSLDPIDIKQVLGRVWRANGKTRSIQRILYAANTIEEGVCKHLATKLDQIDLLMDGDLNGGIFPDGYSSMRDDEEPEGLLL